MSDKGNAEKLLQRVRDAVTEEREKAGQAYRVWLEQYRSALSPAERQEADALLRTLEAPLDHVLRQH